jgi:hydroxymethylpyrimidine pyrophosphatase-like HAD family hydrolase
MGKIFLKMKLKQMAVTDLDGTLLNGNHALSDRNLKTLQNLAKHEIVRVIATGRSLFHIFVQDLKPSLSITLSSAREPNLPSQEKKIILSLNLSPQEASYAFQTLLGEKLDFSVQQQIPENHRYVYVSNSASNPDFERRNKLYEGFCNEIMPDEFKKDVYCQLIAICPPGTGVDKYQKIKELLPGFSVIRSTSPIDHQSLWIEVFNKNVSKLNGIRFLPII